jgi:arylsulfatase A-like enzyme
MKLPYRLLLLIGLFGGALISRAAEKPNVIYILADDLGLGDLSCYGQEKYATPNIDRIAQQGMKFTAHYSGNTVCSPSRAVLMTGQNSGRIYIRGNLPVEANAALDPAMTVLPEIFKAAGYTTGGFGKWGLGYTNARDAQSPGRHGFDEFVGWKSQTIAHTYYPSTYVDNGEEVPLAEGTYVHDLIMNRAQEFIARNAAAKQPFFCYIPTAVPHAAMHAPKALHEKWRKVFPQFDDVIGRYKAGPEECPDVQNPIAGFAAMIENLDNQVGQILELLQELGIDDHTLIIFASDNGAHLEGGHDPKFWNSTGGLRGHKRDMHEGGIRTPMLARWPGVIAAGTQSDLISSFQDIVPTMAELVGQPTPPQVDGISMAATLRGDLAAQRHHDFLYWEYTTGADQKIFSQAVRQGPWKAYLKKGQPMELYRLDQDPFEEQDIAAQESVRVKKMHQLIAQSHAPL